MEKRRLGKSDLQLAPIMLGGNVFGWTIDEKTSFGILDAFVDANFNAVDTSDSYARWVPGSRGGESESIIGNWLKKSGKRHKVLIATKVGEDMGEGRSLKKDYILRECETSLRRLQTDRIDLYQFHWPDQSGTPLADSWGAMLKLRDEGKVRFVGVSNYTTALLDGCEALGHVQSFQPPFSLVRRDVAGAELPWCRAHGAGVIVYSPMQSGLLTDGFTAARVAAMPEDDWRRRSPQFQEPALGRNLALRDALAPIARRHGVGVGAIAVAWTLAWPGVTAAIVGARSPEQVDGWIGAAGVTLDASDMALVARAIERTGAGTGPLAPE